MAKAVFHSIHLPGWASVREPMPLPELRYITPGGRIQSFSLNEAQLLQLLRDASETLTNMYRCRDAVRPRIDACCDNEQRSMAGGCINCGDPCL